MSYKMSRKEALEKGFTIDDCCNPPVAYKGPRFNLNEWICVPTEEVEELRAELERMTRMQTQSFRCAAALQKAKDALAAYAEKLREALEAVQSISNNSEGVAGWHLNGAIATWDDLLPEVGEALSIAPPAALEELKRRIRDEVLDGVANFLVKKADDYAEYFGHGDNGGLSFGSGAHADYKMGTYTEYLELADAIRAMKEE